MGAAALPNTMSKRKQLHAALDKLMGAARRQAQAAVEVAEACDEIMGILEEDMPDVTPKDRPKVNSANPTGILEEMFWSFHMAYPGTKRSARTEFELLKTKHRTYAQDIPVMVRHLSYEVARRKQATAAGEFVPEWQHLRTVLQQRTWESWPTSMPKAANPHPTRPAAR